MKNITRQVKIMFKKKDKKKVKRNKRARKEQIQEVVFDNSLSKDSPLKKGEFNIMDIVAPAGVDRSDPTCLRLENRFVRSFIINGFPRNVGVGWLDPLYNSQDDIDVVLHIEPTDERSALDELTDKITQFEAQLETEREKGNTRNVTRLGNKIRELYAQRERIELNYINLYYIQLGFNLFAKSKEALDKKTDLLDNKLRGRKIKIMSTFLQQDEGFKNALPLGKSYLPTMFRNFSSDALTSCFPFYNAEISHKTGVFLGENLATLTPIYIDFYDRKLIENGNIAVFGKSGSGKSHLISILTLRSALKDIRTVIIDPENDYGKVTKAVGGSIIDISQGSTNFINPFDIEEEEVLDDDGKPTGEKVVKIKDKIADLLNLIGVMAGGLSNEEKSLISYVLNDVYAEKGITEECGSLYTGEVTFNKETMEMEHGGVKKEMPTFSDFYRLLEKRVKNGDSSLRKVLNTIAMFKKGGVYDLFDCQTSENLKYFKDSPIITFDVSKLEENILRPIGMYIALSWTWEKFVKKNPQIKKRVVCDEAWMLMNKNMAGNEYTSLFLETTARRIRKRNGSLLVASQNFHEFANNPQGKAVLTNTATKIFLRQDASDLDSVQDTFKLSDGEKEFLFTADVGHFLLKLQEESTVGYARSFDFEMELIEKSYMVD
jgi:conjugal transfer ATP-binding protein TraC